MDRKNSARDIMKYLCIFYIVVCVVATVLIVTIRQNNTLNIEKEPPKQEPPKQEQELEVNAMDAFTLLDAFVDNREEALKTYKNRVKVKGKVTGFIGKIVILENHLFCFHLRSEEVNKITKSKVVVVSGVVSMGNKHGVTLDKCRLLR